MNAIIIHQRQTLKSLNERVTVLCLGVEPTKRFYLNDWIETIMESSESSRDSRIAAPVTKSTSTPYLMNLRAEIILQISKHLDAVAGIISCLNMQSALLVIKSMAK